MKVANNNIGDAQSLPQDYKQTEAGLIPEDWELVPLNNVFSFYSTSNYSKAQMSEDDEVGCIHYGLIHAMKNTQYDLKSGIKYYVSPNQAKYEYVRNGDVIMVDASEDLEGVNKSVEVFGIGDRKYISGLHTYLLRDRNSILASKFRGIILNSQRVKNQMLQLAVGMKVFGVSKTQLVNVLLPLPPTLTEQKAIATALSDVDALISSLDQLITKKKAIKQGAMQELLTPPQKGGKRLPGFYGEWVEKRLGDIGSTYGGMSGKTKSDFEDGKYPYITFLNVMNNNVINTSIFEFVNIKPGEHQNIAKKGDLFFNTSSETPEEVGMCAVLNEEIDNLYLNSFCFGYRLREEAKIDGLFFSYLMNSQIGRNLFLSLAQGATRYNLSKSNFNKLIILVPFLEEQKAIAQILSDMDAEIDALEAKKAKYQQIKQGMMQELLTGKIRLV